LKELKFLALVKLVPLLLLTSCVTPSGPTDAPQADIPIACDPVIVAYSQERPQIQGAIPQARTEEQASLLEQFLLSVRAIIDYGDEADRVAEIAKQECVNRVSGTGPQ
jgi:hypothetical protein